MFFEHLQFLFTYQTQATNACFYQKWPFYVFLLDRIGFTYCITPLFASPYGIFTSRDLAQPVVGADQNCSIVKVTVGMDRTLNS